MSIALTKMQWKKFAPKCPANYTAALFDNLELLNEAGVFDNERRLCHFMATVYEETGGFTEIRESMTYTSAKRLREVWPSRFGRKSDAELKHLLKAPKALAEAVYGGRMGNRPGTTDAYDTRGGGWFQSTGYGIVSGYCEKLGVPYSSGALDDPVLTLKFAVLEWQETNCNTCADENSLRKVAKAINTGSADSNVEPVGMDARKRAFARAWAIWGDTGKADVPAKTIKEQLQPIIDAAVPAAKGIGAVAGIGTGAVAVQQSSSTTQPAPVPMPAPKKIAIAKPPAETTEAIGAYKSLVVEYGAFAKDSPYLMGALIICVLVGAWLMKPAKEA